MEALKGEYEMGHKNYSKFSGYNKNTENNKNTNEEVIKNQISIDEVVNEPVIENNDVVNELVIENNVENVNEEVESSIGIVTGCKKLYVRKEANKDSTALCIINEKEEVKVNLDDSTTEDFYKVCTSSGIEGYCMKKYITIK